MVYWGLSDPKYIPKDDKSPNRKYGGEVITSPFIPPDANRVDCMGLKSRPRTGPVCVLFLSMRASEGLAWPCHSG